MWRNPKYFPPEAEAPPPPAPSGEVLASVPRPGGRFGPPSELRVTLDAYQGHPYISVRLWTQGPDGQSYPSRKGVSIRLREAEAVAAALVEAARRAERDHPRPGPSADRRGPRRDERRPAKVERRQPSSRGQAPPEYDPEFDECR